MLKMISVLMVLGFGTFGCTGVKSALGISADGTSDSGGGNGTENKVYESYIVDPSSLDAYKQYIIPLIQNIRAQETDRRGADRTVNATGIANLLRYKTWYIAPVELGTISKDVLGVSFSKDQTQQLAIQTNKAVWINSGTFAKMDPKDQANLVIHEFVMSIYFIKYKSFTEVCRIGQSSGPQTVDCGSLSQFDEIYPAKAPKALDASDYDNIRRMTSFFILHGSTATLEEINRAFEDNEFDPRLFGKPPQIPRNEQVELPVKDVMDLFSQAAAANKSPDKCRFVKLGLDKPCSLSVVKTSAPAEDDPRIILPYYILSADAPDGTESYYREYLGGFGTIFALKGSNPMNNQEFYIMPIPGRAIVNAQVGQKIRSMIFVATQKENIAETSLRLNGVISVSGVITKVSTTAGGMKVCEIDSMNPRTVQEDLIITSYDTRDLQYLNWLSKQMRLFVTCK
jgi:hypothetical protein